MNIQEKNKIIRKINYIIKFRKISKPSFNRRELCTEMTLSYKTLITMFSDKQKKWMNRSITKINLYIDKFEKQYGPINLDAV